jgi:hypothetical protein
VSFQIAYVGGGMLDKIRSIDRLESGRLDFLPSFPHPYVLGNQLEAPNKVGTIEQSVKFNHDVEIASIAVDTYEANHVDSWEIFVGNKRIVETISTLKYPEGLFLHTNFLIPSGTEIKLVYHNNSGRHKYINYHYQIFSPIEIPVKTISESIFKEV